MPALSRLPLIALLVLAPGCAVEPSDLTFAAAEAPATPAAPAVTPFDPAAGGTISGHVGWAGPIPITLPFVYGIPTGDGNFDRRLIPNPNRPDIDPTTLDLAGAVVFLRGPTAAASKPWDLPPARVEMADREVRVRQGDAAARRVGFVRRGAAVAMASVEPVYHVLRGRGAAYFSLTFPDLNDTTTRTFDTPGRVELSSGAGYYWASADLFVDDHPYYTLTDPRGRFVLADVPAGPVELVVWLPGWGVARFERDPESGLIIRQTYDPPVEVTRQVTIDRGRTTAVTVTVAAPPGR